MGSSPKLGRAGQFEGAPIDCEAATDNTDTPLTPLGSAPAYIANGHAYGVKVARVQNVAELLDEHSPHADMAVLKAQTTLLMRVVTNHAAP